jgi:hypothetical protein
MAAGAAKLNVLLACALLLLAVGCKASPYWPLEIGFYHDKCPQAESVVKGVMEYAISKNPGNGAAMIRMLFHDCFVEVLNFFDFCSDTANLRHLVSYIYLVQENVYYYGLGGLD